LRVLIPGGRLAINVGPVLRARKAHGEHHVLPLPASILTRTIGMGYRGLTGITWRKVGTVNAEGGGRGVLGKPGQPNGVIESRSESILLLKKPSGGRYRMPTAAQIRDSHIEKPQYAAWFRDLWDDIPGARSDERHPCPFPIEIPRRLVSMFSFTGDVVLDPFGGLGTTSLACAGTGRNSIYVDCSETYTRHAIARMREGHRELLVA
jgi:site-specific DNA-methyltransferase (adenine-specific)